MAGLKRERSEIMLHVVRKMGGKDSGTGGVTALARLCGVSRAAVSQWKRVPGPHVRAVSKATGIPMSRLRPDLYARPANPMRGINLG